MTTISPNYAGVNFRGTEQVQPKKVAETNVQAKPESKGMSNVAKAGIGLAALATIAVAGMAIKNKNTANSLKNLLKKADIDYKKVESASYEGCVKDVQDFMSSFKPKSSSQYAVKFVSPQHTKHCIETVAKTCGTTSKNMKIPEKGFILAVTEDGNPIMSQFIDAEKYTDSLLDLVEAPWKEGKIFVKPIKLKD